MVTIQDVAKHAQVGVGTVSRVLSGKGYVKEETRQKVQASIEELDYTPNEMARNLFFRKSGIVAVIVPELGHPFFSQFVNEVEKHLCEKGYQTMICNTHYTKNYEQRYLNMLKQQRVDGIIFGSHTVLETSQIESIRRPMVALDRNLGNSIPSVSVDHRVGGRMAAEELIRSGCKKVYQFCGVDSEEVEFMPFNIRHKVFEEMMKAHGIACFSHKIEWHFSDIGYYQEAAERLLDDHPDVDGVFATDIIIMAVLQSAMLRGKRVPEELKLVGYDGTYESELTFPRITTIAQPIDKLAQEAVNLIVDLIDGKTITSQKVELEVTLRPGDTTMRG